MLVHHVVGAQRVGDSPHGQARGDLCARRARLLACETDSPHGRAYAGFVSSGGGVGQVAYNLSSLQQPVLQAAYC